MRVLTPPRVVSIFLRGIEFFFRAISVRPRSRLRTSGSARAIDMPCSSVTLRLRDREVRAHGDWAPCASARQPPYSRFFRSLFVSLRRERTAHRAPVARQPHRTMFTNFPFFPGAASAQRRRSHGIFLSAGGSPLSSRCSSRAGLCSGQVPGGGTRTKSAPLSPWLAGRRAAVAIILFMITMLMFVWASRSSSILPSPGRAMESTSSASVDVESAAHDDSRDQRAARNDRRPVKLTMVL